MTKEKKAIDILFSPPFFIFKLLHILTKSVSLAANAAVDKEEEAVKGKKRKALSALKDKLIVPKEAPYKGKSTQLVLSSKSSSGRVSDKAHYAKVCLSIPLFYFIFG